MKIITASAPSAESARQKSIETWVKSLRAADAAAKAGQKEPKRRLYSVNYRVSESDSRQKGNSDGRRAGIHAILEALQPRERHISTSTYLIAVHIESADTLIDLLMPPLDAAIDGLHVRQASPTNGTHRGHTGLKA